MKSGKIKMPFVFLLVFFFAGAANISAADQEKEMEMEMEMERQINKNLKILVGYIKETILKSMAEPEQTHLLKNLEAIGNRLENLLQELDKTTKRAQLNNISREHLKVLFDIYEGVLPRLIEKNRAEKKKTFL